MPNGIIAPLSILIVEDDDDTAQSLAELLFLHGHTAIIASCGSEALREIATIEPDVVLLDIGLPDMTGWELARRLRFLPKPPVLIAVTAYSQEADYSRSAEAGIHLHLLKPVQPAIIVGILKRFVRAVALHNPHACPF